MNGILIIKLTNQFHCISKFNDCVYVSIAVSTNFYIIDFNCNKMCRNFHFSFLSLTMVILLSPSYNQGKYCDNTYSLGKYSPNSKNYCPESGTPTSKRGRAKGERVKDPVE